MSRFLAAVFVLVSLPLLAAKKTEILWDTYGVPHIYAANREDMFYAHGWAQMRNQSDLLLLLYGESRGRAAEYWGGKYLSLDRWVQTNGVPERAQAWYSAQDPTFRRYLDAFARGINDFAKAHPERIGADVRCVLPVSGVDVVGHALRAVHYMYMGSRERMRREVDAYLGTKPVAKAERTDVPETIPGSNTWAVGPSHSASHKAMLIINPHLAWGETFYRYMEVHLSAPDYELYGAPQIGFPVPVVGFNRKAGWGRTVNTIDTVDFYRITVRSGKYEFDGKLLPFERQTKNLKVKQADGTFHTVPLEILRTVHGPVVFDEQGVMVAMRVAGLDRPKMLEQWFRMGEAQSLEQFKDALRLMSVPMWNANYADAKGHIMLVFDGLAPRRGFGDWNDWSKVMPGNTSKTLWTEYLSFEELPKSIDPASGFNQNTNEPPWTSTLPALNPANYPAYLAPSIHTPPSMRTLRSLRMLTQDQRISYEQLLADKHSTRMELADAVLPDLLKAATTAVNADVLAGAAVLSKWDHNTSADSRGAVLFQLFFEEYFAGKSVDSLLRVHWNPEDPLHSEYGLGSPGEALKSLAAAVQNCRKLYGALDVPWGDVYRFASGRADLPGNGGDGSVGVFRTIQFGRKEGNKHYATSGETFVCAVEFARTQRANCLLSYGNASQHGSVHLEDQLPLLAARKLRPVWRDKSEVKKHLELREVF